MIPPVEYPAGVQDPCFAHGLQLAHARLEGPVAPFFQIRFHRLFARLLPKRSQRFFEQVAFQKRLVLLERLVQPGPFFLLDVVAAHEQGGSGCL